MKENEADQCIGKPPGTHTIAGILFGASRERNAEARRSGCSPQCLEALPRYLMDTADGGAAKVGATLRHHYIIGHTEAVLRGRLAQLANRRSYQEFGSWMSHQALCNPIEDPEGQGFTVDLLSNKSRTLEVY